jgi:tetratricopeptide (TPR) repeat protein
MTSEKTERSKVFISYSRKDEFWLKRLQVHLKPLIRDHKIAIWDDTAIRSGSKWQEEIKEAINSAKIAILMVSPDFFASDFIIGNELPPLLRAAEEDGAQILLLIVSHSRFERTQELSQYQSVNLPSNPLNQMSAAEVDKHLDKLAQQIEYTLNTGVTSYDISPQNLSMSIELAEIHRQAGRFEEAITTCTKILAQDPRNIMAFLIRATAYLNTQQRYENVAGDAKEALRLARQDRSSSGMAQQAEAYSLLGLYEDSIKSANLALDLNPQNILALRARAISYFGLKDYDSTLSDAASILSIEPWNAPALRLCANAYLGLKQYEQAVENATKSLALAPDFWWALYIRASAYNSLGREKESIKDLSDLLEKAPWCIDALKLKAAIHCDIAQYEEAIFWASQLLKYTPNDSLALCIRADAYFRLGLMEQALANATETLRIDPEDKMAMQIVNNAIWAIEKKQKKD